MKQKIRRLASELAEHGLHLEVKRAKSSYGPNPYALIRNSQWEVIAGNDLTSVSGAQSWWNRHKHEYPHQTTPPEETRFAIRFTQT